MFKTKYEEQYKCCDHYCYVPFKKTWFSLSVDQLLFFLGHNFHWKKIILVKYPQIAHLFIAAKLLSHMCNTPCSPKHMYTKGRRPFQVNNVLAHLEYTTKNATLEMDRFLRPDTRFRLATMFHDIAAIEKRFCC